ncbi:3-hydroxyacyl-CoA dehydrogenase NAD-binding domain-containing protein [Sphingobacterium hotanense]|uniref:3-hydroxyacyl-CoA dehydrogenase NAD-binding domain-containing protein n=1 Tax=Sphingobacterium hotanense TaxID=649196 RepID=UPI0011F242DD|nr:3-hydroxyacyl-CoA dehydrogenase NAD-binding domain-containing protein [Sphingobacterium hotanense]
MRNIKIDKEQQGILRFEFSNASKESITVDLDFFDEVLPQAIDFLAEDSSKAIIFEFKNPAIGTDYRVLFGEAMAWQVFVDRLNTVSKRISRLKAFRKPIVCIVHAECSSAAYSFASMATYILLSKNKGKLGFPETKFGLMPGFGGTINLLQRLGPEGALNILSSGKLYSADEALKLGIANLLFEDEEEGLSLAMSWIAAHKQLDLDNQLLIKETEAEYFVNLSSKINRAIPGQLAIVQVFQDSLNENLADAYELEAEAFCSVLQRKEPLAMLRTQYYGTAEASKTAAAAASFPMEKVGVIGAGMMGAGIAYEAAKAGFEVVLRDISLESAERGKAYSAKVLDKSISLGKATEKHKEIILERIHATDNLADMRNADLIVEAVFEDIVLKNQVIAESADLLNEAGVFASNTTSLPISKLAIASKNPANFIGLHFFSPVDRMPLVEVICGKQTSKETLNKALHFISKLKKIPIVVQDGPAFFTSRIFFNYLLEGISMIQEGIPLEQIEGAARLAGFGVGPLAVLDEITLDLMVKVYEQLPKLHASQQRTLSYLKKLIAEGRSGRRSGKGFYDYPADGGKKQNWQDPEIAVSKDIPSTEDLKKRLLHVVALDSYRCLNEGILSKAIDGDIGSIFGLGYPPHTGGVFGHIDQVGLATFVEECKGFAAAGEQWEIPPSLEELAKEGYQFYNGFEANVGFRH